MDSAKNSSAKCTDDAFLKSCSILSFISMLLFVALFLRMETINRRTEINEMRISDVESRMKISPPNKVDDKDEMKTSMYFQSKVKGDSVSHDRHRQRKNVAQNPTADTISKQNIRQEINQQLHQVCKATDKICLTGPPGPPGAHGYPGYKGEKGYPGKTGPRGPLGPLGAPGARGIRGPVGPQGVKGEKGDEGYVGARGIKGGMGPTGHPGDKGSIGLKGRKGIKGSIGIRGPKGHLVVSPKINVFPESQIVIVNKPVTFYCWVDGHTSTKTTWRKLEGTLVGGVVNGDTLHIKNVQKSHAGSYLCSVFTGYGVFRTVSTLGIKEPPTFRQKPPSHVLAALSSTLKLCCDAPEGSVSWSRVHSSLDLLPAFQQKGCLTVTSVTEEITGKYICRAANSFGFAESTTSVTVTVGNSCDESSKTYGTIKDGEHFLAAKGQLFKAYCGVMGWTLIARFSNTDHKNWMDDRGYWWYDLRVAVGKTTDPSVNADMISPAFWLVNGREFKITRSDDPSHTPLLQTTGNCLAGQTFRSKITSYGDFRNGKVWASNQCLGSCTVQYGGQYKSTEGFQQADCSGNIQSANKIGFWCDYSWDGSVLMIGGGGSSCVRADHGIGITETDAASFVDLGTTETEYDFGYNAYTGSAPSQSYSLNLWIR